MFAEQFAGAPYDPTIYGRHELVAFRRGEKFAGRNDFAAIAEHADQQLEPRPSVAAAQRQYGLRVEAEAIVVQRFAQLADHQNIGVATNDALVGILKHFHAIAAAIFRGLAGDFRGG